VRNDHSDIGESDSKPYLDLGAYVDGDSNSNDVTGYSDQNLGLSDHIPFDKFEGDGIEASL
jgi:hypothetical protein